MEIELPKIKEDGKNINENQELMSLINEVFNNTEAGKKLLVKLSKLYISDKYIAPVYPVNMSQVLQQFGSTEVYSGFRAGQAAVIFMIDQMIDEYKKGA